MILGQIQNNQFGEICLILEVKFGDDPLLNQDDSCFSILPL